MTPYSRKTLLPAAGKPVFFSMKEKQGMNIFIIFVEY